MFRFKTEANSEYDFVQKRFLIMGFYSKNTPGQFSNSSKNAWLIEGESVEQALRPSGEVVPAAGSK